MTQHRISELKLGIAWIEARYDDHFPPCVYAVLEKLRKELSWAQHEAAMAKEAA